MIPKIYYINTDLDLVSGQDLTPLAEALVSKGLLRLGCNQRSDGLWYATFETGGEEFEEADPNILAFLTVIEALEPEMQRLWLDCTARVFDIGCACGDEPTSFHSDLAAATLERVVAVGAALRLTLYPGERKMGTDRG